MATVSTPHSLGEMLRRARELRGLTLERIARETKIPQRHLEAFERDNLTAVPSGFYQRAELRTYAQAVGLDQRLALAELESALAPVGTREPRETRENRGGQASMSPLPYIAAAVAGIAVIAALFGRASLEPASQLEPRVETPAATDSAPTPGTVPPETAASSVAPQVACGSDAGSCACTCGVGNRACRDDAAGRRASDGEWHRMGRFTSHDPVSRAGPEAHPGEQRRIRRSRAGAAGR